MLVENTVRQIMENEEDEGLWNQMKQGAKSFFGRGYGADKETNMRTNPDNLDSWGNKKPFLSRKSTTNFKQRLNAAKSGFKEQGRIDSNDENTKVLNNLMQKYGENMTLGQVAKRLELDSRGARGRVSGANNKIYTA